MSDTGRRLLLPWEGAALLAAYTNYTLAAYSNNVPVTNNVLAAYTNNALVTFTNSIVTALESNIWGETMWWWDDLPKPLTNSYSDYPWIAPSPIACALPTFASKITAIAGTAESKIVLTADGKLYSWGNSYNGQLGRDPHPTKDFCVFVESMTYAPNIVLGREMVPMECCQVRLCLTTVRLEPRLRFIVPKVQEWPDARMARYGIGGRYRGNGGILLKVQMTEERRTTISPGAMVIRPGSQSI